MIIERIFDRIVYFNSHKNVINQYHKIRWIILRITIMMLKKRFIRENSELSKLKF